MGVSSSMKKSHGIDVKRVYEEVARDDGVRFLVDRLWPRGIRKDALSNTVWLKDVAPSNELRKWFGHDPARWKEFQKRYYDELKKKPVAWKPITDAIKQGNVTLLFGAKDLEMNQAVVLKEFLEGKK